MKLYQNILKIVIKKCVGSKTPLHFQKGKKNVDKYKPLPKFVLKNYKQKYKIKISRNE